MNEQKITHLPGLSLDMRRAIATLTERQQECFIRVCFEGLTEKEAAVVLSIDQAAVNRHIEAAKKKLQIYFSG